MNKYELLETIGEGAYGIVIKAKEKDTGRLVAIKRFKESDEDELVRKTTLREVKILRSLKDENYIVKLLEAFRRKGRLYLVFEYVGKNLLELLEEHPNGISEPQLKRMVFSMLLSVHACHSNGVIHRDIKPENLLLSKDNTLRLCDFGFARQYQPGANDLTDYVATRWYRSPELLLGTSDYSLPSDIFAAGCIMAELIDGQPLFPGESEIDQMHLISKLLGQFTPAQQEVFSRNPRFANHQLGGGAAESSLERKYGNRLSKLGMQLLRRILVVDPAARVTAIEALQHPYFEGLAAELCPQLAPLLTACTLPTAPSPVSVSEATVAAQRPDTRGSGHSAGGRRRSAQRMLPQQPQPYSDEMPAIGGSRPASRGQVEAPGSGNAQATTGARHLRNIGAAALPHSTAPHSSHQGSGFGTPGPYSSAPMPISQHRSGSGHGRRAQVPPKPTRGPMDVLDHPEGPGPSPAFDRGSVGYGGYPPHQPVQQPVHQAQPFTYTGSSQYKPQPHPANLPKLSSSGLPPSGNGPAPAGVPPMPNPGSQYSAYNPFLSGNRTRQPTGSGRFGM